LAEHGVGLVCVPDFAIRRQVLDGTLKIILAEHIDHSGMFRAMWPSSRYLSPKVRVFVDFLAEHLFPEPQTRNGRSGSSEIKDAGNRPDGHVRSVRI
jgi:DNA-binding transcriptional LysR family regulator